MNFVIVTPIWKEKLSTEELKFLRITNKNNSNLPKYFLTPDHLNINYYRNEFPDWKYIKISGHHLSSTKRYSQYLLKPDLYKKLDQYRYLVICQTDAVLIKNISDIKMGDIDYIGAPWHPPHTLTLPELFGIRGIPKLFYMLNISEKLYVGNGGLSIRRINKFLNLTKKIYYRKLIKINEDVFFSYLGKKGKIKCASSNYANQIFNETTLKYKNDIPDVYGFHAMQKWNSKLAQLLITDNK